VGKTNDVDIGEVDGHSFRKGTPVGEAGLKLIGADLLIARAAFIAVPTARCEWNRDAFTDTVAFDVPANGENFPGELVAGHMRQANIRIVAAPAMPITATQTGDRDPDHHAIDRGRRISQVADHGRVPKAS
jgi:hypothetical protein